MFLFHTLHDGIRVLVGEVKSLAKVFQNLFLFIADMTILQGLDQLSFENSALSRHLVGKGTRHNTREQCHGADSHQCSAYSNQFAQGRDRGRVPVTHGGQRDDGPPHGVWNRAELVGLCLMFGVVRQTGRYQDSDAENIERRNERLPLIPNGTDQVLECSVVVR